MQHELVVKSITMQNKRGQVLLQTATAEQPAPAPGVRPLPPEQPAVSVGINFIEPTAVTAFVYGKTYRVTFEQID
jgi:hypothetical protein